MIRRKTLFAERKNFQAHSFISAHKTKIKAAAGSITDQNPETHNYMLFTNYLHSFIFCYLSSFKL